MANENNFKETVNSLFKGMDSFISAKTVVGEAIHVGDTIILPLMDVSFGVGAGAFSGEKKDNGGGGMAGKMTPCAVLVIQNGTTKLVNVKNQDGLTKILDMVPDFVDRFTSGKGDEESVGEKGAEELEKLFGFMLFFIGIGMIIGMLIAENVVLVVSAGVFLLLGYHLFCH